MTGRRATILALAIALAGCFRPTRLEPLPMWLPGDRSRAVPADAAQPHGDWAFTVDAAIAYAVAHGALAGERRDQEQVAEARISAAGQLTNPELRLGQATEQDPLIGQTTRFVVALRVFPDMPWALDARVAGARASYRAELAVTTSARRALAAQIRQLYAQLAFADATRTILARRHGVLEERRRVLGDQVQHHTATRLEVLLADQDATEIGSAVSAIDLAMTRHRAQLAGLLGIAPGQAWKPVWDLERERAIETSFDHRSLERRALARPEFAELGARAEAAEAGAYEQRTHRLPWLRSVQVERSSRDEPEWAVSATITLPLLSLSSGDIAVADAQHHRLVEARRRLAAQTLREVGDAIELAEATGRRAKQLRDHVDPLRTEIDALFVAEKSLALADPVKLLLLEERNLGAERAVLDAACEHRMARIALEALAGDAP